MNNCFVCRRCVATFLFVKYFERTKAVTSIGQVLSFNRLLRHFSVLKKIFILVIKKKRGGTHKANGFMPTAMKKYRGRNIKQTTKGDTTKWKGGEGKWWQNLESYPLVNNSVLQSLIMLEVVSDDLPLVSSLFSI